MPSPRRLSHVMQSGDSAACLVSTRARMVDGASRGATKVYTTDDRKFRIGEVVIFTDLEGNIEAHRVKGYGSLIIDTPLTRDYPAGSEVRTLMGPERVCENGPKQYVGYVNGRQWIARVILPETSQPSTGTAPLARPASPPQATSVPVFGAQYPEANNTCPPDNSRPSGSATPAQGHADQGNPGGSVLGSPGINLGNGSAGLVKNFERREQARSASPITVNDERILSRYFTRGSQGIGEEDRAAILFDIERGVLEAANHTDTKEKWNGLDSALPPLPQCADEDKSQVHVRAIEAILHHELLQLCEL
eukprot:5107523-Amphidinium_carterae.3